MIFEQMIMEETLAQLMQGSEALDLITAQPAVLKSSSHVRNHPCLQRIWCTKVIRCLRPREQTVAKHLAGPLPSPHLQKRL